MKTLISWLAFNNDFVMKGDKRVVNPDGPTFTIHNLYFDGYDRHIILSQEKEEEGDYRLAMLQSALKASFGSHKVEHRYMDIKDVIDMEEIKSKVEALLTRMPEREDIDIFISPGTPAMQAAWYILQLTLGRAKRLLQLRKSPSGKHDEFIEAKVERSKFAYVAILSNQKADLPIPSDEFFISNSIQKTYHLARQAANAHGVPVLIKGETGTGKEHLARTIHAQSARKDRSFQAINCGALTESLLESQLFGYEKGAFTGATKRMVGIFEATTGGTVFLDEIGELSPKTQTALLRVLQSGEIWPLMSSRPIKVDVRLVAASHQDLYLLCTQKAFRWDLYYRLAVIELDLPPLREWDRQDREHLFQHIAEREVVQMKVNHRLELDRKAMDAVLNYSFPGNIREMENLIRRLLAFNSGKTSYDDLPSFIREPRREASLRWEDSEKALIEKVLSLTGWNQAKAQELLGYGSVNTLRKKIKDYDIVIPRT